MRVWKVRIIGQGAGNIEKTLNEIERTPGVTLHQILVTDHGVNVVTYTEKDVSNEAGKTGKAKPGPGGDTEGAGGVCQAGTLPDRRAGKDDNAGTTLLN
jgi:hypothetical protein